MLGLREGMGKRRPPGRPQPLTRADVARIAKLARLAPTGEQLETSRVRLSAILGYMERLQSLDLKNVEPLSHPGEQTNVLADDHPGPTLPTSTLMSIAPRGRQGSRRSFGCPRCWGMAAGRDHTLVLS